MAKRFLGVKKASFCSVEKFRWQEGYVCSKNSRVLERVSRMIKHNYVSLGPSTYLEDFNLALPMEFLE